MILKVGEICHFHIHRGCYPNIFCGPKSYHIINSSGFIIPEIHSGESGLNTSNRCFQITLHPQVIQNLKWHCFFFLSDYVSNLGNQERIEGLSFVVIYTFLIYDLTEI